MPGPNGLYLGLAKQKPENNMTAARPARIFLSPPHMSGAEQERVRQAFDCNYISPLGPQLDAFEQAFRDYTGLPYCAALSSGTAALHLALEVLGVRAGDVVVASSLTFIASVGPAHHMGADLVFVDCDRDTWNMDPDLLAQALETLAKEGRTAKAVIPTDLYGQCADYDRIEPLCQEHGALLVVDAAEAVGATYKGRHAGSAGHAAVFSFNGNKIITTGGGGMLASADQALVDRARWLSQQARDPAPHYEHSVVGHNYRMSNVLGAIGLGQMEVLSEYVARRRAICDHYREALGSLPGVSFMPEAAYGKSNRWLTVMLLDPAEAKAAPEDVRLALEKENIESRPVWKPMHMQPVFAGRPCFGGEVSREFFERGLCLPSGTAMTDADMDRVCSVIRGAL